MTEALPHGTFALPPGTLAEVVTHLEMVRRPDLEMPAERTDLQLRHARDPALPWYRALFRKVGEPWLWSSRLRLDDAALGAILRDPDIAVFAAEHAGTDVGLLELDFRVPGEAEIVFFGLAPGHTGRGLGGRLMAHALAQAWSRPITRLWLHTCTSDHPAALPFYIRHGFVPFRRELWIGTDPRIAGGPLSQTAAPHIPML